MIFLTSNLGPTITDAMLAAGPFFMPAIFAVLAALAGLAWWLLSTGIRRRSTWRLALGAGIAAYLGATAASFFLNV